MASAGVAKWTTAPVLKTGSQPGAWVRIPFPAPKFFGMREKFIDVLMGTPGNLIKKNVTWFQILRDGGTKIFVPPSLNI